MDDKTTENEAITQPFEPEPLSEQTMVSNATVPLQVPETPPPPPPIPQNYVPPGDGNSTWKWIVGSTLVVVIVIIAGAIGFTTGYGEGCPCDATRDTRNHLATVSPLAGSATAVYNTVGGQALTIDAQREIIAENDLLLRETIVFVEGTSNALSTALFVNATSRATQQSVSTANVMTIQAAETTIFEQDMELTSVYATNAALQGTPTSTPPSEALEGETPTPISIATTPPAPPAGSGLLQILPSANNATYPFDPEIDTAQFRDAWLHEGCQWQGISGDVIFLPNEIEPGLQIRAFIAETPHVIVAAGTNPNYGDNGWEAKLADGLDNQTIYHVQLFDNDGATPLSPIVEVRFSGECTMNLLQINFNQVTTLGVGS